MPSTNVVRRFQRVLRMGNANSILLKGTKRGVKIHDLEIALEGNFENILKWAGHSQSGNPGYPSIKAKCFVRADADETVLREIWQAAVDGSPARKRSHASIVPRSE